MAPPTTPPVAPAAPQAAAAHPAMQQPHDSGERDVILLRVKRRREEAAPELLYLEAGAKGEGGRKKGRMMAELAAGMAALGTGEEKGKERRLFAFARVGTLTAADAGVLGQVGAGAGKRQHFASMGGGYREVRRLRLPRNGDEQKGGGPTTHIIELARPSSSSAGPTSSQMAALAVEKQRQRQQRPHYIFRPLERELDEAIGAALQGEEGMIARVLECVARGADVDHQRRNHEDASALMACAARGDVQATARLLRLGANARLRDAAGRTALDYVQAKGNAACEIMLREALLSQLGEEDDDAADTAVNTAAAEEEEEDGFVYDEYALQRQQPELVEGSSGASNDHAPVLRIPGLGWSDKKGDGEGELVFEADSDWGGESDGEAGDAADEDSNAEDYHANDYPDTPSESSSIEDAFFSSDEDDGLGGLGFRMRRPPRGEYGDSSGSDRSEEGEEGEVMGRRPQGGLGLFGRRPAGVGGLLAGIGEEGEEEGVAMGVDAATRRHLEESTQRQQFRASSPPYGGRWGNRRGGLLAPTADASLAARRRYPPMAPSDDEEDEDEEGDGGDVVAAHSFTLEGLRRQGDYVEELAYDSELESD